MSRVVQSSPQTTWRIFRWPFVICVMSIAGLIAALVGDGWWDAASWLLLGSLVILMIRLYAFNTAQVRPSLHK